MKESKNVNVADSLKSISESTRDLVYVTYNRAKEERSWRQLWQYFSTSYAFLGVHVACLLVFWAGVSWIAIVMCLLLTYIRLFGITAGFHRYFSHRTYKTSRVGQFLLAWLGTSSAQMGPLWWAAHHRHHHRFSDQEPDVHSPITAKFWWSHFGWILDPINKRTNYKAVRDFARFPELRFLNEYHMIPPIILAVAMFYFGVGVNALAPGLGTSGLQMLTWGFFVSTVLLYHLTFTINSVAHVVGNRRFETHDDSRNNWFLALITLGEGWHNNHHYYPGSERQGFYWWEIDLTHYGLKVLSWFGLVWNLRKPPEHVLEKGQKRALNAGEVGVS